MPDTAYHPHKIGSETPEQTHQRLKDRLDERRKMLVLAKKHIDPSDERLLLAADQLGEAERDLRTFENPPPPDGFRAHKKRPKGWAKQAMDAGIIRDPSKPEPAAPVRKPGDVVIGVPVARADAHSKGV